MNTQQTDWRGTFPLRREPGRTGLKAVSLDRAGAMIEINAKVEAPHEDNR